MLVVNRGCRMPARTLLDFKLVPVDQGSSAQVWAAADHKHAFTITREGNSFVAHVSWLDGSQRRKIGRRFKMFDSAVGLCSIYTRVSRRQVALAPTAPSSGTIICRQCWRSRTPRWTAEVARSLPVTCMRI